MDDHTIITLYHARDERAIRESERKYGEYCLTVSMNVLDSRPDAEECVNDTWLRAWGSMPPAFPQNLRAYLAKITRNLSINRLKALRAERRDARLTLPLEELEDVIPAPDDTPATTVCAWLDEYLDTLPDLERRLFVGRYWYAYPVRRLAAHYGLSPNAVTKRLIRVKEGLRAYLTERGYTP